MRAANWAGFNLELSCSSESVDESIGRRRSADVGGPGWTTDAIVVLLCSCCWRREVRFVSLNCKKSSLRERTPMNNVGSDLMAGEKVIIRLSSNVQEG